MDVFKPAKGEKDKMLILNGILGLNFRLSPPFTIRHSTSNISTIVTAFLFFRLV
jgi:hypothetical protein